MNVVSPADRLLIQYLEKREDVGAPGLNIADSDGRVYHSGCGSCDSKTRHFSNEKGWVCGHCGAIWKYDHVTLLKGEISCRAKVSGNRVKTIPQYRAAGSEHRMSRQVDMGVQYHQFIKEGMKSKLYVLNCMGQSIKQLTKDGPSRLGQFRWTTYQVYKAIKQGRASWTKRMEQIGLL